jgi:SH3 domain protein
MAEGWGPTCESGIRAVCHGRARGESNTNTPKPLRGRRVRLFALLPIGLCAVAALAAPAAVLAETQYVTDRLEVPLRAGEKSNYKIRKMLPSGTALEVLGVNQKSEYAHVRTPDGIEGFVPMAQIQAEPAARDRLAEVETRLKELQQHPDALASQLARLQTESTDIKTRLATSERERQRLEQELATLKHACTNVVDITSDRERLRIQVAALTRARADLEQTNRDLSNQTNQRWFMIGAGVLVGGVLLGLILPHLRVGRRKSSWGSL